MKKIIICIFIILSSCSFVPESPQDLLRNQNNINPLSIEEMHRLYPFWNIQLMEFRADNMDAGTTGANGSVSSDPVLNAKARVISIRSKEAILQIMNKIRFVVNTPEFADRLRKQTFRSSRNGSTHGIAPYNSIKLGDPMDSERLVKVLQKVSLYSQIRRTRVPQGADGAANVGPFLYEASDTQLTIATSRHLYVALHNNHSWDNYDKVEYRTRVVFHELLHNMGFTHKVSNDATFGIQNVFQFTYEDPAWQKKYKKQLESFQYYTKRYSHFLQKDTMANQSKQFNNTDLFTINQTQSEDNHTHETHNNEIEEVCILYPDGTHKLVKVRNGHII